MKHISSFFLWNIFFSFYLLNGCEEKKSCLLIPGLLNGYAKTFEKEYNHIFSFTKAQTPQYKDADFGGIYCQCSLYMTPNIQQFLHQSSEKVIYATSQGTATTLFLLTQFKKNHYIPPQYVIIEGPIASINDAMVYAISHASIGPLIDYKRLSYLIGNLPYSSCWLPYIAHYSSFKNYDPTIMQPIEIIKDLPKETTFILLSGTKDDTVPIYHARALYFCLKNNGFNAHLIEVDTEKHIDLFEVLHESIKSNIIAAIQQKSPELPVVQHEPYQKIYTHLIAQDKFIKEYGMLKVTSMASALCATSYLLYKKCKILSSHGFYTS